MYIAQRLALLVLVRCLSFHFPKVYGVVVIFHCSGVLKASLARGCSATDDDNSCSNEIPANLASSNSAQP